MNTAIMGRSPTIASKQTGMDFTAIEGFEVIPGDKDNIDTHLPMLFPLQRATVLSIEQRFITHKGRMITDGTGTGKTFVGLGVAKRFNDQGKGEQLILVPTDKKCRDWIKDAKNFCLDLHQLKGIQDGGHGITVTTYANFYQNQSILKRDFDLVIYDECHYLGQNGKGDSTVYHQMHAKVTMIPSAARDEARKLMRPIPSYGRPNFREEAEQWANEHYLLAKQLCKSTKVLFMSATPFAYHKSIKYVDGALFNIEESLKEKEHKSLAYNEGDGFNKFLMDNFGYRMSNNKLTIPEVGVDQGLMERQFFEKCKEANIISTTQLDLEWDYSRHFITLDSEIGLKLNEGLELFWDEYVYRKYPTLCQRRSSKHTYMYISQLLESVKAREIGQRVLDHLYLDRKVVIFHGFNNNVTTHPFHFEARNMLPEDEYDTIYGRRLRKEIVDWENEYPQYRWLDLSGLDDTRSTLRKLFPEIVEFNGTVSKKKRNGYIQDFNDDYSGVNIILVQTKAGREGISLHDTTGERQRVMINLSLPVEPTRAIQEEGRIYREGLRTNALYEYATLQTPFERSAFAEKVAMRAKTAENLAMGDLARDLETAFKEGYQDASYFRPHIGQGRGGKKADRTIQKMDDFQKAKSYYWSNQKRRKSSSHVDYFATPEPLGYMMVKWLDPQPEMKCMEPSTGHGAISRWFPATTVNHFMDIDGELASKAALVSNGTVAIRRFEDHSIVNKYDRIAANPPFGNSGKLVGEHLEKIVFKHMNYDSLAYIIVPDGPAMEKRINKMLEDDRFRYYHFLGELFLPECAFERAGTKTMCKIIKIGGSNHAGQYQQNIDLRYCKDINEFFETIKDTEF